MTEVFTTAHKERLESIEVGAQFNRSHLHIVAKGVGWTHPPRGWALEGGQQDVTVIEERIPRRSLAFGESLRIQLRGTYTRVSGGSGSIECLVSLTADGGAEIDWITYGPNFSGMKLDSIPVGDNVFGLDLEVSCILGDQHYVKGELWVDDLTGGITTQAVRGLTDQQSDLELDQTIRVFVRGANPSTADLDVGLVSSCLLYRIGSSF